MWCPIAHLDGQNPTRGPLFYRAPASFFHVSLVANDNALVHVGVYDIDHGDESPVWLLILNMIMLVFMILIVVMIMMMLLIRILMINADSDILNTHTPGHVLECAQAAFSVITRFAHWSLLPCGLQYSHHFPFS